MPRTDLCIVDASHVGLACASAAVAAGLSVTLLEARREVGRKPHTTGILVREAVARLAPVPPPKFGVTISPSLSTGA